MQHYPVISRPSIAWTAYYYSREYNNVNEKLLIGIFCKGNVKLFFFLHFYTEWFIIEYEDTTLNTCITNKATRKRNCIWEGEKTYFFAILIILISQFTHMWIISLQAKYLTLLSRCFEFLNCIGINNPSKLLLKMV